MIKVIKELEQILSEVQQSKDDLNRRCEIYWNLLCPAGTQEAGMFKIERNETSSKHVQCDEISNLSSQVVELIDNVNDVIAYGKHIRNTTLGYINKRKVMQTKSETIETNKARPSSIKCKVSTKELKTTDTNCNKSGSSGKSSLYSQKNHVSNFNKNANAKMKENLCVDSKTGLHSICEGLLPSEVQSESSNTTSSVSSDQKYSHHCSLLLSDTLKTLKMPEDLRCLLKKYHNYEQSKLKHTSKEKELQTRDFKNRFINLARRKLENDIENNIEEKDCYLKYVEIACNMDKRQEGIFDLGKMGNIVYCRSEEDLHLFEAKCHRLMELQHERRMLNVINALISDHNDL